MHYTVQYEYEQITAHSNDVCLQQRFMNKSGQITTVKEVFGISEQTIQIWKAEDVVSWDQSLHLD